MARRIERPIGQRAWWRGRLCALDLETTGPDAHHDRLVSAAVVWVGGGVPTETQCWLARPTVPIPPDAAAVHGISDELAQEQGRDPAAVVGEVADALRAGWALGLPVVAFNASFDLTVLAAELERHGLAPLTLGPVIDPLGARSPLRSRARGESPAQPGVPAVPREPREGTGRRCRAEAAEVIRDLLHSLKARLVQRLQVVDDSWATTGVPGGPRQAMTHGRGPGCPRRRNGLFAASNLGFSSR